MSTSNTLLCEPVPYQVSSTDEFRTCPDGQYRDDDECLPCSCESSCYKALGYSSKTEIAPTKLFVRPAMGLGLTSVWNAPRFALSCKGLA